MVIVIRDQGLAAVIVMVVVFLFIASSIPVLGQTTPAVAFTTPVQDEIVAGQVVIKGTSTNASKVEIKFDAEDQWRQVRGTQEWTYLWDAANVSNDSHTLFARARNGTTFSDVVSLRLFVDNSPPDYIVMDVSATPLDVGPLENITMSGFIEYDTGVKMKTENVDINILGASITARAITDDLGYFIMVVTGPADAGRYTISMVVTDGVLEGNRTFDLSVTTPYQPDLTVSKIELNPPVPKAKDQVEIFATIDNLGDQGATARLIFSVDDKMIDDKDVKVDRSSIVSTTWTAIPSNHTIKVELKDIDPTDKDPSNDFRTLEVFPKTIPVVSIKRIAPSNPFPRQGVQITLMVKLVNEGYAGTTGIIKLYDGAPSNNDLIGSNDFTIRTNETISVYINWKPKQGEHTLHASISVVGENETDGHSISKDISVLPPLKKKADTPAWGAVALIVALGYASVLLRKRTCGL